MSRISGHYAITKRAVTELKRECPNDVFIRDFHDTPSSEPSESDVARMLFLDDAHRDMVLGFGGEEGAFGAKHSVFLGRSNPFVTTMCNSVTDLGDGAVCKDLEDVIDGNHWRNEEDAQAGHFMCAEHHSPRSAYDAALRWILLNVNEAATEMYYAYLKCVSFEHVRHHPRMYVRLPGASSGKLTGGKAAKLLGRAVHCLQDSFSASHVKRAPGTESVPGAIEDIFVYTAEIAAPGGAEQHNSADHAWRVPERIEPLPVPGGWVKRTPAHFSTTGIEAVNATKALILLATWAAIEGRHEIGSTHHWQRFCRLWLTPSPSLPSVPAS